MKYLTTVNIYKENRFLVEFADLLSKCILFIFVIFFYDKHWAEGLRLVLHSGLNVIKLNFLWTGKNTDLHFIIGYSFIPSAYVRRAPEGSGH